MKSALEEKVGFLTLTLALALTLTKAGGPDTTVEVRDEKSGSNGAVSVH